MATTPFRAITNINQAFEQFEEKGISLMLPKLLYFGMNMISVGLAFYKFSNMGIVPVQPSDWAGLYSPRVPLENSQLIPH